MRHTHSRIEMARKQNMHIWRINIKKLSDNYSKLWQHTIKLMKLSGGKWKGTRDLTNNNLYQIVRLIWAFRLVTFLFLLSLLCTHLMHIHFEDLKMVKYSWIRHAANWDCIHNKHCYEDHTFFSGFNLISSLWLDIVQISILINFHCIHVLISFFDGVNNDSFAHHPGCTKSLFHSACKCVFRIVRVEIFITKFLDESIGKIKVFRFKVHRQWPIARFIFFANDLLYERLNLDFVCKKNTFSHLCVYT